MFDIYRDTRRGLLVLPAGRPIPSRLTGSWLKRKRKASVVSEAIRNDIDRLGFHLRDLGVLQGAIAARLSEFS